MPPAQGLCWYSQKEVICTNMSIEWGVLLLLGPMFELQHAQTRAGAGRCPNPIAELAGGFFEPSVLLFSAKVILTERKLRANLQGV